MAPNKYLGYCPSPPDTVRRLACYSANVVSLRVALEPEEDGVALTDLLRAPDDALTQWRSTVRLWQAGLDPDGLGAMLSSLALEVASPPRVAGRPRPWSSSPGTSRGSMTSS